MQKYEFLYLRANEKMSWMQKDTSKKSGCGFFCIFAVMNIEEYRDYCLSLGEGIEEKFPFTKFKHGEGVLVFYVCGHMFSFFDCDDFKVISLKCQPERIEELKAEHPYIGNPFNESPKHWIGIDPNTAPDALLEELTRNSYEIVKAKYSKTINKNK